MITQTTAATYVALIFYYTELCFNVLALRLLIQYISGKEGPTRSEHLRTLVGGLLPQGERNLLMFEIRSVTNPHLVPAWGFTLTPALQNSRNKDNM